jgi:hypothetical protein
MTMEGGISKESPLFFCKHPISTMGWPADEGTDLAVNKE